MTMPSHERSRAEVERASVLHSYRRHLSSGRARLAEFLGGHVEVASSGVTVRTSTGKEFLNFGGYGVFFTGARHPKIVEAVRWQLGRHPLSTRLLLDRAAASAADALAAVVPPALERIYFTGSGTEATEAAIKLARANGRRRLISMVNGYHGKTLGALSITARSVFQDPFRPLLGDVVHVDFDDIPALSTALGADASDTAVFIEPIQGEAGVIIPAAGYLARAAQMIRERRALLVLDEVMTGLGRSGRWWAADWVGVVPDMMLVGKTLSGGVVPCAALVARDSIFAPFSEDPFLHTSTFAGSPLAMAAARASIDVIASEELVPRAARLGDILLAGLRAAASTCAWAVREVRGMGLLIGIEFTSSGLAGDFIIRLIEGGVIANHSLNSHAVVRFTPPAVAKDDEIDRFLSIVQRCFMAMSRESER